MTKKKIKKTSKKVSAAAVAKKPRTALNFLPWIYLIITVLGIIYMANVASQYTDFGLDRDEGTYMNLGEVLRDGGEMYKDAYSFKPPAIFYSYAAINTIFGFSGSGLRWSLVIANAFGAFLLFLFGYRWRGPLFGCVAALAYTFFAFNPYVFGFAALAESYQNVIAIVAAVCLQHGFIKKNAWFIFAGGAILTYAVLFKQNLIFLYGAISIGLACYYLIESKVRDWKSILVFIGGSALSALLIYLPVIVQGNFENMIYWNFTYSSLYTSSIPWEQGQTYMKNFFNFVTKFNKWMWVVGFVGVMIALVMSKRWSIKLTMLLVLIASIASVFPGYRFYPHYWSYFSPILAVGCAYLTYMLSWLIMKYLKIKFLELGILLLFIGGLFYTKNQHETFFDAPNELQVNRRMYGDNPFTENRYLGEYLKKQINKGDELLIFGSEPEMYAYIEKLTPTPYMFFAHLTKPHDRRDAMVADLQQWAINNKPKYVYFSNHPFSWLMTTGASQDLYRWATGYVSQNHKVIGVADIIPGQAPKLILGDQAASYQTQSQKWVKIYERVGD